MTDILFNRSDLRAVIESHEKKLYQQINEIPENQLLNTSVDDLCLYFVEEYTINVPILNRDGIQMDYGDVGIDVSRRSGYAVFRDRPTYVTGTIITFYVPFEGDKELFKCRPSTFNYNPPRADVQDNELVFQYQRTISEIEKIEAEFKHELQGTEEYLSWIKKDVTEFNNGLPTKAHSYIEKRRDKILKDRGLVEKIGFPLKRSEGISQTYIAPQVKRKITPRLPSTGTAPFAPEPTLDMAEYDHILSVVSNMVVVMERSPSAFKGMKEEDLRQHFLVQLNGQYEGQATGETFNFNGKTDILVRVEDKNIFVAECKFWGGPEKLKEALDQLLGYATWRDSKLALLVFNRDRALSTVLEKLPEVFKGHKNFKREVDYKSETGFRYIFGHLDDSGRELTLTCLVFEVPV
ncbi:MAG: hypothetical protein ACRKGH_03680 [Dehalogenimonas sp.]